LVGLNLLKSLDKLGHDVSLFGLPSNQQIQAIESDHKVIRGAILRSQYFDYTAPSICLHHQFDLQKHVGGGKRFGATIFELDRLKPNEVHQLKSQDVVIVPSKWAAKVVKDSCGPIDVKVVPLGYDPEVFYPRPTKKHNNTIIQSWGKIEIRKGHDVLVDIFNKAFTKKDNVELQLGWSNPFLSANQVEEWERLYKNSPLGEKISFIPWQPTQQDVANRMAEADCGIFPSRAEGWGLECLEMMAMGKEVIVTNVSAHTEYCFSHNSYLIECPDKEPANDAFWFHSEKLSDGAWAKIGDLEIDQAVEFMRTLHKDKQEGRLRDSDRDVSHLTWDNAAVKLVESIQ